MLELVGKNKTIPECVNLRKLMPMSNINDNNQ